MKKILVATDFSVSAENAARYALMLGSALQATIVLVHAFKVPNETRIAAQVAWPLMDYPTLKRDVDNELVAQVNKLRRSYPEGEPYCPDLSYEGVIGRVDDVITSYVGSDENELVVMGVSGASATEKFFLGSNTREMIDRARFPLLLIPYEAAFKPIKKIVFATDLGREEIAPFRNLHAFASQLGAEIVIVHITNQEVKPESDLQKAIDSFLKDAVTDTVVKVRYEYVWNIYADDGLVWIAEQPDVDMIALSHHRHQFIHRTFIGSHTQRLSRHVKIPLLVFRAGI